MTYMTPITIVTGYRSSGKTTVINHLFRGHDCTVIKYCPKSLTHVENIQDYIKRSKVKSNSSNALHITDMKKLIFELTQMKDSRLIIELDAIVDPKKFTEEIVNELIRYGVQHNFAITDVITVLDAKHFWFDFSSESYILNLESSPAEEIFIAEVLTSQIEFSSTMVLNKCYGVSKERLDELIWFITKLQPNAALEITEDGKLINYHSDQKPVHIEKLYSSSAWNQLVNEQNTNLKAVGEYGIGSFIYQRDLPFEIERFKRWLAQFPQEVLRSMGRVYLSDQEFYSLSQSGPSITLGNKVDLNEHYFSSKTQLLFIGIDLDYHEIVEELDKCLSSSIIQNDLNTNIQSIYIVK